MTITSPGVRTIRVEVAYGTPQRQELIALEVQEGTTALQAARQSGIAEIFPDINLDNADMGIFSLVLDGKQRPSPDSYVLQANDRVEIYRPLIIDPKSARIKRARGVSKDKDNQDTRSV